MGSDGPSRYTTSIATGNILNWTNVAANLVNTVRSNVDKDDLCSFAKPDAVVPSAIRKWILNICVDILTGENLLSIHVANMGWSVYSFNK